MRRIWLPAVLAGLAACAAPSAQTPARSGTPADGTQRYEASATVLESPSHGPELCLGGVMTSLPPQCGGPPLNGWDWSKVSNEERANGTIWGDYHVVGTYDGRTFTLTETPGPPEPYDPVHRIGSRCTEPPGGWERPRPADTTDEDAYATSAAAGAEPDFAGFWIDDPNPPNSDGTQNMSQVILNAVFTGDLRRHETELRKHWGGALCVAQQVHTLAELERIRTEVEGSLGQRGLKMLTSDADEVTGVVKIDVIFFEPEDQAALDAKYGKGVVVLSAALRPVS